VDPLVATTTQPYVYATDDPVSGSDPSGNATVGECVGGGAQFCLINIDPDACLTRTIDRSGEDDIGLVATLGVGGGAGADISLGAYYQVTSATNLNELKGWFWYLNVALDIGFGANATIFWNTGDTVRGANIGISVGGGAIVALGKSYTRVVQFNNSIEANVARGVWDGLNPGLALNTILGTVAQRVDTAIRQHPKTASAITSGGSGLTTTFKCS
jgi:hypothetical protein